MDYRYRKYYLVSMENYNETLKNMQSQIESLEVHKPYNHFINLPKSLRNKSAVYDGDVIEKNVQVMLTCKNEDYIKLESLLINKDVRFFIKLNKDFCLQ